MPTRNRIPYKQIAAHCAAVLCALFQTYQSRASAQVVHLADLEAHAVHAQPLLRAAESRVAQAMAGVERARAVYAPTISALGEASISPGHRLVGFPDPSHGPYKVSAAPALGSEGAFNPVPRAGIMLDVRGNLYDFGRTAAAVDSATSRHQSAEAEVKALSYAIVRDVRAAYVQWATAHALWLNSISAFQDADQRKQMIQASIQEGSRRPSDLLAAASGEILARLDLARAAANRDRARRDLAFIASTPLSSDAHPEDGLLENQSAPSRRDIQNQSQLDALHAQRAAALATARAHDRALAPVVSASAQAGLRAQTGGAFPLYQVGLNLAVPLWDGGADRASRVEAAAVATELDAQIEAHLQEQQRRRENGEAALAQTDERISIAQELVQVARARLSQLEEGYPLGAVTLDGVNDARTAFFRAQAELILAKASRAEALLGVSY
jgi:outer membrane protein TolC